jgi:hypothetical protein
VLGVKNLSDSVVTAVRISRDMYLAVKQNNINLSEFLREKLSQEFDLEQEPSA